MVKEQVVEQQQIMKKCKMYNLEDTNMHAAAARSKSVVHCTFDYMDMVNIGQILRLYDQYRSDLDIYNNTSS